MKELQLDKYLEDPYFNEWYKIVKPILNSKEFKKRKYMKHHDESVYSHSVVVSFTAFKLAKKRKKKENFIYNCAVAGLLHDFYTKAWQYSESLKLLDESYSDRFINPKNNKDLHGFTHPKDALLNSRKFYSEYLNKRIEDSILKHMFPLTPFPPKCLEGWYITTADKIVSFLNLPKITEFPKYVGIGVNKKRK